MTTTRKAPAASDPAADATQPASAGAAVLTEAESISRGEALARALTGEDRERIRQIRRMQREAEGAAERLVEFAAVESPRPEFGFVLIADKAIRNVEDAAIARDNISMAAQA